MFLHSFASPHRILSKSKSFQPQSNSYKAHKSAALRFEQLKNGKPCAYT
jgi:hypothetical protein